MKKLFFIIVACFSFNTLSAQTTPLQLRLYGEAGYYFPSSETSFSVKDHDGSGAGFGLYGLMPLYKKWSLLAGAGYRYLNNGQSLTWSDEPGYGSDITTYSIFTNYPKHYLLIPVKLRYTTTHSLYLQSGIETAWLLNYKYTKAKTEYNWTFGVGTGLGQLDWSVQYVQGLTDQAIGDSRSGGPNEQFFTNRHLSVEVSCPLWKKRH
ncbi:MAG: hypothetical protein F9K48_11320 [Candidatus Brocadia sp.]|nr:MAG: hypothetical protein F9K48_11320 [Candidatus Brocadia sp.]